MVAAAFSLVEEAKKLGLVAVVSIDNATGFAGVQEQDDGRFYGRFRDAKRKKNCAVPGRSPREGCRSCPSLRTAHAGVFGRGRDPPFSCKAQEAALCSNFDAQHASHDGLANDGHDRCAVCTFAAARKRHASGHGRPDDNGGDRSRIHSATAMGSDAFCMIARTYENVVFYQISPELSPVISVITSYICVIFGTVSPKNKHFASDVWRGHL